jgi:D-alanyl-lipoteichoic acid acyltransferase DltB (MBOAT superfamily)
MLFNSPEFLAFFLLVFAVYWAIPLRAQNLLLLTASYVFYGWWGFHTEGLHGFDKILPVVLLLASTVATHYAAVWMDRLPEEPRQRRAVFWLGIVINVGLLGYFKYRVFFVDNLIAALSHAGWNLSWTIGGFVLPAGISFYTFQSLAYLIDVHGGAQKPATRLYDFARFHAFFPQLVAGPIERPRHLLPQLLEPRTLTPERFWSGLQLIIIGYVKKVAIADAIAPLTERAFGTHGHHSGLGLLLGIYLFALQIYGDFSGYTDIARGAARLLGMELMLNFRQPYFSRNITEFWERWHVSLSTWLRDYLFVPLCRHFRGRRWIPFNLMLTMLISGVWHGASWNFVLWGLLLGAMLVVHKLWSGPKAGKHPPRPRNAREWTAQLTGMFITFHCVCLTLILVKTENLPHAWNYFTGIFTNGADATDAMAAVYVVFYGALVVLLDFPCWWHDRELPLSEEAPSWSSGVVYGSLLLLLTFLGEMEGNSFVYFQF